MKHFFTKTVAGSIIAALGYLSQPEVMAVLPKKAAAIVTTVGIVVSVLGVRGAIAKNGAGL